jgi:Zn-finger nucleic acid-binding protein
MEDKDYYKILGISSSASAKAIAAAYRRLVRKYHPDRNPSPDATRHTQAINEAYAVLGNPARRAEYDRLRVPILPPPTPAPAPAPAPAVGILYCPRDHTRLTAKLLFGVHVRQCALCDGMWIERENLIQLYKLFDLDIPATLTNLSTAITGPIGPMHCLVDGAHMMKTRQENVDLDVCPTCRGMWFDATDFAKVVIQHKFDHAAKMRLMAKRKQRSVKGIFTAIGTLVADTVEDFVHILR